MTRRFWMSFADERRPEGQRFLGVAIVEVTGEEAAAILPQLDRQFPQHQPGAEWIAAAAAKAGALGCNPGGSVASVDITDQPLADDVPRHQLMSKDELLARGLA